MCLSDTVFNLRDTAHQPEVNVEHREVTSQHSTGNSFSESSSLMFCIAQANTTFTCFSTKLRDLWLD